MDKVISARGLTLAYNNEETIINNAQFDINSGEFVFLTGASGSGKSTILKSLYGELPVQGGELSVAGVSIPNIKPKKLNFLRKNIGIVFQDYKLINEWDIEKNVMLPLLIAGYTPEVCDTQVSKLLSHVKLSHQTGKLPVELSGGEQQRVAMARALAHNPIMILADEPTGNLDDYSASLIWNLLEGANEQLKTTVVVVTHHIPETFGVKYRHFHIESGSVYEIA
jgi:cell division transport system ATP-binding protein